ncbi:MAG: response regulator transcription factor [Parvibaculaceae bacterium]
MKLPASARLEQIGQLIQSIGTPAFPDRLLDLAAAEISSDAELILLYRRDRSPSVVADRLVEAERPVLYGDYLSGVYRLSPFYRAASRCRAPCVHRLGDVAPAGFRQSEYHRLYFSRIGVSDLIAALLPLAGQGVLHVSMSRMTGHPGFSGGDQRRLEALLPVLSSASVRHWRAEAGKPGTLASPADDKVVSNILPELTAREAQIVEAMLSGHSPKAGARLLGISAETIRVHRKHVYAKLDVSSQAELFSLYLTRLRGGSKG